MAFAWVIRHQKKVLFVLAAFLIVMWGLSGVVDRLLSPGRNPARSAIGRIAGQDVMQSEFTNFMYTWKQVFPAKLFALPNMPGTYAVAPQKDLSANEVMWAYLGLYRLAKKMNIVVSDSEVLSLKRMMVQQETGRPAIDATPEMQNWFHQRFRMSGEQVDEVLRQRLMAETALMYLLGGLDATTLEAKQEYNRENRAVKVKYVTFPADGYLASVPAPADNDVKAYYEARQGPQGKYFNPRTAEIEYAAVSLPQLEAGIKVSVDDMKKFYEENKEHLYRVPEQKKPAEGETKDEWKGETKGATPEAPKSPDKAAEKGPEKAAEKPAEEAAYMPFPEVQPEIDQILKRNEAAAQASKIFGDLRKKFGEDNETKLEPLVKDLNNPAVKYARTASLDEAGLAELRGIGTARLGGNTVADAAFDMNPAKHELSGIFVGPDGRCVFRTISVVKESTPALEKIRNRVIADWKKERALDKAKEAAKKLADDVLADAKSRKVAEGAAFASLAEQQKLPVKETGFFVNNLYDVNRPAFIDRGSPLDVGSVYGPMASVRDNVAAVVGVVEERLPEPAGFKAEKKVKLETVLSNKSREFLQRVFPKGVLEFLGYEDLLKREKPTPAEESEGS